MKKLLFLAIFMSSQIFGQVLPQIIAAFKNGEYKYVCERSLQNFHLIKKNENLVTMYAYACLKSDMIDRLAVPLLYLKKSVRARKNRTYFSIILMEKNLLVSSLCDGLHYDRIDVPLADFYISKIVDLLGKNRYLKSDNSYIFFEHNKSVPLYTVTPKFNEEGECYLQIYENLNNKMHIIQ